MFILIHGLVASRQNLDTEPLWVKINIKALHVYVPFRSGGFGMY